VRDQGGARADNDDQVVSIRGTGTSSKRSASAQLGIVEKSGSSASGAAGAVRLRICSQGDMRSRTSSTSASAPRRRS
jgi:hypothetical protein